MKKRGNKTLYLSWSIIVIVIVIFSLNYNSSNDLFLGIAESREVEINFEKPVEIKRIYAFPGKKVTRGDLLIELKRPDLTMEINRISHDLDQFFTQGKMQRSSVISRINQLQAEKAAKINNINFIIKQLRSRYDTNVAIMKDLKSLDDIDKQHDQNNPILQEIKNKKQELAFFIKRIDINIQYLQKELQQPQNTQQIQAERLRKELALLHEEENKLKIYAKISGVIGSVNFKENEKVSAFSPILTIHPTQPHLIKGYIHENISNTINVGDKVTLISYVDQSNRTIGEVIGIGARIVEFPERLRKVPEMKMWGREVSVTVPENNRFLLGEKILLVPGIDSEKIISGSSILYAKELKEDNTVLTSDVKKIVYDKNIEASGVLYLPDIRRYLVISDDTYRKHPLLYLMNQNGVITKQVKVRGLKKINDMESVTIDDEGNIYILTSLSYNKKHKLPRSRKLLIKIKRNKDVFTLMGKINLYDEIVLRAQKSAGEKWADFILTGYKNKVLEVESCSFFGNDFLLGFKAPYLGKEKEIVILRLCNITKIFENNTVLSKQIEVWKTFNLNKEGTYKDIWLSDLFFKENNLYLLTNSIEQQQGTGQVQNGQLWKYNIVTEKVEKLITFQKLRPEGVTFDDFSKNMLVVFDNGNNSPSQFYKEQLLK